MLSIAIDYTVAGYCLKGRAFTWKERIEGITEQRFRQQRNVLLNDVSVAKDFYECVVFFLTSLLS